MYFCHGRATGRGYLSVPRAGGLCTFFTIANYACQVSRQQFAFRMVMRHSWQVSSDSEKGHERYSLSRPQAAGGKGNDRRNRWRFSRNDCSTQATLHDTSSGTYPSNLARNTNSCAYTVDISYSACCCPYTCDQTDNPGSSTDTGHTLAISEAGATAKGHGSLVLPARFETQG